MVEDGVSFHDYAQSPSVKSKPLLYARIVIYLFQVDDFSVISELVYINFGKLSELIVFVRCYLVEKRNSNIQRRLTASHWHPWVSITAVTGVALDSRVWLSYHSSDIFWILHLEL
ncbi:unnamed protein product [Amaranthus hypochondriacus]